MRIFYRFLLPLGGVALLAGILVGVATGEETSSFSPSETSSPEASSSSTCLSDPSVLDEIRDQREKIAEARKVLDAREKELKARELALHEELKKLQDLRDEITKTDNLRKAENQEKVAKVIETLETMSPKAAAKMLAELDDALAVEAISRMDTVKLAKIMNLIDPKRASHLSESLAGVVRARVGTAAPQAVAGNYERTSNPERASAPNSKEKGGEKDDGQNNDKSNGQISRRDEQAGRQPSSAAKAQGRR